MAPDEGEVDANNFFFEDGEPSPLMDDAPPVGVPSIGVQPLSPNLRPIMPVQARPMPLPPKSVAPIAPIKVRNLQDDDDPGPVLPLAPAKGRAVMDEDAPL
jgi:hypothetical protein